MNSLIQWTLLTPTSEIRPNEFLLLTMADPDTGERFVLQCVTKNLGEENELALVFADGTPYYLHYMESDTYHWCYQSDIQTYTPN